MKINVKEIKNSKPYSTLMRWSNSNFVASMMVIIVIWLIVSIPFDIYLLVRWGVGPEGFWQELAIALTMIVVIGWAQALLLIAGILMTIGVMDNKW